MAAAQAWKTRFRERVVEAEARLRMIPMKIIHARVMIAAPLHGMPQGRTRSIQIAEQSLEDAASDLYTAASLLGSATELAFHGGGAEVALGRGLFLPCNPLQSTGLLPAAQRHACDKLLEAKRRATQAYDAVELCCGHLLWMRRLLDRDFELLPGVDERIDAERIKTHNLLGNARGVADDCLRLVASAGQDVAT